MMRDLYFFCANLLKAPIYFLKKVSFGHLNRIERGVFLSKTSIGNYNYIGHYCIIDKTRIGSYCSIGANVLIGGADHGIDNLSTSFRLSDGFEKPLTVIEDDVWIGAKATLAAGVRVGRGAVIGASSFVKSDVEPYSVVVGTPAKTVKLRFGQEKIKMLLESRYWEMPPDKAKRVLLNLSANEKAHLADL